MLITPVTVSYDIADILGVDYDATRGRTSVFVSTNIPGGVLIDTDSNQIRLDGAKGTVGSDGTGSVILWPTNAATNPTAFQYWFTIDYTPRGAGKHEHKRLGPFSVTGNADLADLIDEQEIPPTYLSTVTALLDGYVDDAQAAQASAEAARDQATEIALGDADATLASAVADLGSLTGAALAATIAKSTLAMQRTDRQAAQTAASKGGDASIAYSDATEVTKDWANLTGWQAATNAQTSSNKLYAVSATNPGGALRDFSVAAGEVAHISTLLYWKAGGSGATYFGLDFGAANHAPVASSPDGIFIGVNGGGSVAPYRGSGVAAITWSAAVATGVAALTTDTTFYVSIDIGVDFISFSMRDVANPNNLTYFFVTRSTIATAGKAINNIAAFIFDARGTSGNSFGPVTAVKSRQPARTKTLGGQTIDGTAHRFMATAVPLGNPWRVQLPKTYDARKPSPVVIWCHQSLTGDADDPWTEARMQPLTTALADAGYIFASTGDVDSWGNNTGLTEYAALYAHVRDRYNTGPVYLIGVSMGALVALNLMARRTFPTPAAFVSIGGVCNLADLWAQAAYDDGIATAYAISSPDAPDSEYETKTAGHNPIDRQGWEFRGVPMRFYTSTGDTAVPKATGCDVLAAKVAPYAPEASVVVKSGGHLDASQYPPSEIVTFFDTYR